MPIKKRACFTGARERPTLPSTVANASERVMNVRDPRRPQSLPTRRGCAAVSFAEFWDWVGHTLGLTDQQLRELDDGLWEGTVLLPWVPSWLERLKGPPTGGGTVECLEQRPGSHRGPRWHREPRGVHRLLRRHRLRQTRTMSTEAIIACKTTCLRKWSESRASRSTLLKEDAAADDAAVAGLGLRP